MPFPPTPTKKKKPAVAIAIGVGPARGGARPSPFEDLDMGGGPSASSRSAPFPPRPSPKYGVQGGMTPEPKGGSSETPEEESSEHNLGPFDPMKVTYHTSDEECQGCTYWSQDHCRIVLDATDPGGHCALYEGGMHDEESPEEDAMEGPGAEAEEGEY